MAEFLTDNVLKTIERIEIKDLKHKLNIAENKAKSNFSQATIQYVTDMQKLIKDAYTLGYYDGLADKQGINGDKTE